ncbi:MAG: hypothetical protein ACRC2O_00760, partial [Chitinophagaceae bacterium]
MKDKSGQIKQENQHPGSTAKNNRKRNIIIAGSLFLALIIYMIWPAKEIPESQNNITPAELVSAPVPAADKEK